MTKIFQINRLWVSLGIPFLIIMVLVLLTKSTMFQNNVSIGAFAITFDLLITVPLVYFLSIRKSKIPITTVVPVLIIGLIVGTYILPPENQYYLDLFKVWGLPVVELLVLSFIVIKVRHSIRTYKEKKETNPDFFSTLKESCAEIVPQKLVPFLATEIAVIYYGFIKWKKIALHTNEFTYHKRSGTIALIGAIIFIVFIETFVIHILLEMWSDTAAWIVSVLSVYTAIQLFGFLKSLSQRPIAILNNRLIIRYGILAETEINLQDIESIELHTGDLKLDNLTKKLSPLGDLESHNIIIKLKKEYALVGLYGRRKKFTNLALFIDDEEEFKKKVESILQENI